MTFDEWLQEGLKQGWCGPSVCYIHDGLPTSLQEELEMDKGDDICIHIIRLYEDQFTKSGVEDFHAPSVWRATNSGYEL